MLSRILDQLKRLITSQRERSTDTHESLPDEVHGVPVEEVDSNMPMDVGLHLEYAADNHWRWFR